MLLFFHLSEYVWQVARAAWPEDESNQQCWVELQQSSLKASQWREVITAVQRLSPGSGSLKTAQEALERYLLNN